MFDKKIFLFTACLLAFLPFPRSPQAATLSGFVTVANSGEFLPYATIIVDDTGLGAQSNSSGYYAIKNISPGVHSVTFSHIGYQSFRDTVVVVARQNLRLNAALKRQSIDLDEETLVTAQRDEQERIAQTSFLSLQPENLQQMPAIGEADLLRSLQLLPGIQAASDISSGLYIRGGGPDETRILLDQIPIHNPSHAFGFFSTFNPDAIDGANLYKGAYPATYEGNLGALLDVTNREGNHQEFHSRGGLSLLAARLLAEGPAGQGSWMLSGRRTYLDPLLAALRAANLDVPNYYFYDLNGKFSQRLSTRDTFLLSAFWSQDHLNFVSNRESFFDLSWGNRAFAGRLDHIFSPTLFGRFSLAHSAYKSTTSASFFDTPLLFANGVQELRLRADIDYFSSTYHTFSSGLALSRFQFNFGQSFNQKQQIDLATAPLLLSFYLHDEWRPSIRTHLRLGVRANYFDAGKRWFAMPRISLSHTLQPGLRLKLGSGLYRQYLQLVTTEGFSGTDFWVPLDSSVSPGRSWQGVVGVEWEPSRRYKLSLEGYYRDLKNLVVLDNNVAADSESSRSEDLFKTGGRGYATGLELLLEKRGSRTHGWIGYTLGWTRRRFPELNQGRLFPPKYDRRHDLSLVISHRHKKWTWGANFVYGTGQAFTPASERYTLRIPSTGEIRDYVLPAARNSARLLPYHRLDLSLRRAMVLWGSKAEVYLQIFNAYNRRNEWFIQYDTDNAGTEPEVARMLPAVPTLGLNFKL